MFGSKNTLKEIQIENLDPYENNSRTHSEQQIEQVANSIKEFGFLNPVITDGEGGIIAGHCRVLAAKLCGMSAVPCVEAAHLSESQKRAYIIADNKLATNAGWDDEILKAEIETLQGESYDLGVLGWDVLPSFAQDIDYSVLDDDGADG